MFCSLVKSHICAECAATEPRHMALYFMLATGLYCRLLPLQFNIKKNNNLFSANKMLSCVSDGVSVLVIITVIKCRGYVNNNLLSYNDDKQASILCDPDHPLSNE